MNPLMFLSDLILISACAIIIRHAIIDGVLFLSIPQPIFCYSCLVRSYQLYLWCYGTGVHGMGFLSNTDMLCKGTDL